MKKIILILFCIISSQLFAQELAKFTVQIDDERIDAPVSVSLDGINYNTDKGDLVLYEITKGSEKVIPSQLEPGYSARL
ncbi:MAG: hypothetical protein L3J54_01255, partial [Draconibacterium sp.]|nr:hypothetical protein [Draconibacterium sp.]